MSLRHHLAPSRLGKFPGDYPMQEEANIEIDATGLPSPLPVLRANAALAAMHAGQSLLVRTAAPGATADFEDFSRLTGHSLKVVKSDQDVVLFYLKKR